MVTRRRTRRASRTSPRISTEASTRLSMLPPEIGRPTRLPAKRCRMLEQRGERRAAGAFGHGLLDLDQRHHRALDGLFLHHQHFLRPARWMMPKAMLPTSFTAMPSAMVSPPHSTGRPFRRWCIEG